MGKHHHDATCHFSHLSTHEYKYVVVVANTFVPNALFHVYVGVGYYTFPLDHSVLVQSDI